MEPCKVYVICAVRGTPFGHEIIKVGISKSVASRIDSLKSGCPYHLREFASFTLADRQMALMIEQRFHRNFSESRLAGEWFDTIAIAAIYMLMRDIERFVPSPSHQLLLELQAAQERVEAFGGKLINSLEAWWKDIVSGKIHQPCQ